MSDVTVTQADELAAENAWPNIRAFLQGEREEPGLIDAFARHRSTHAQAEPVVWMYERGGETVFLVEQLRGGVLRSVTGWTETPLYAHPPAQDVAALVEQVANALDGVIAAFPSYRTRNGKSVSIEASDGEKCWIIHDDVRNDAINARAALASFRSKP